MARIISPLFSLIFFILTFTKEKRELPVAEGHLIADELNAQAALADLRVMTKDAHHAAAKWLVGNIPATSNKSL